jgi:LPXTG-site transpeptidase (sortase) family protein
MRYIKKLVLFLLAISAGYVLLNGPYFYKQAQFYLDPPASTTAVGQEQQPTPEIREPDRLWIPSLGIQAPIVYTDDNSESSLQLALRSGVVHYPGSALPGEAGNTYLMGHSSDYPIAPGNYKTVFALLPRIKNGETVEITGSDGVLYRYKVQDQFVADPDDTHLLMQDKSRKQLTLQTSYPIGTALKRYIVTALLQE